MKKQNITDKQNKSLPARKSKKAQEEVFGFVIIIVMLVIIGLIFLFFYKPQKQDLELEKNAKTKISNLLYSINSYDSGGVSFQKMVEECNLGERCNALSDTLSDMLDSALEKGSLTVGKQIRGYSFDITDTINLTKGNLTGNMIGSSVPVSSSGDLIARLNFYY